MPIQVHELACQQGVIGQITLDSQASLNALSEDMIDAMQAALDRWQDDDRICLVVVDAAGDRAFCAGGDIVTLYQSMTGQADPEAPRRFFSKEYQLLYHLHCFPKPVIGWAQRVVMGGGMGLLSACRYRLVTPDLIMAMPEITIGLFPDVGASWFLNRLPAGLGLFLGLTGARLNASDALRVGLADMAVHQGGKAAFLDQLQSQSWTGSVAADDNRLYRLLNQLDVPAPEQLPTSELASCEQTIAHLCRRGSLQEVVGRLLSHPEGNDWWQSCISNLRAGCPVTACLVSEQLKRGQQMALKDIFEMELAMALECTRRPDLREGVRALMIDRDQTPAWTYNRVEAVPQDVIDAHFIPDWTPDNSPIEQR